MTSKLLDLRMAAAWRGSLGELFRRVAQKDLPDGELYIPDEEFDEDTPCLFIPTDVEGSDDMDEDEDDFDAETEFAASSGFPSEGLNSSALDSIWINLLRLKPDADEADAMEAYGYYLQYDGYMQELSAESDDEPPPPQDEVKAPFFGFISSKLSWGGK